MGLNELYKDIATKVDEAYCQTLIWTLLVVENIRMEPYVEMVNETHWMNTKILDHIEKHGL